MKGSNVSPSPRAELRPRQLDSWKEIAAYLRRDVRTVQRWERLEGLPVHRHLHEQRGSVFAVSDEVDAWQRGRHVIQSTAHGAEWRPTPTTPLIGREELLAQLNGLWARAMAGVRQTVFIAGELGIGKTALVETFLSAIGPPCFVTAGSCVEQHGTREPFLPVVDALARLTRGEHRRQAVHLIEKMAPSWRDLLLDRRHGSTGPQQGRDDAPERSPRELVAAIEALSAVSPLVIVFEDLHWSDHATIELISRVARRHERASLLVIGTYRREDVSNRQPALWRLRHELSIHDQCTEQHLPLLDEHAVRAYLESCAAWHDVERAARWFHSRTEGNPLFLVHLVQHLLKTGVIEKQAERWFVDLAAAERSRAVPETLQDLFNAELDCLAARDQRALEIASTAGEHFSAVCVAAASGTPLPEVEDIFADLARRRRFVVEDSSSAWRDDVVSARYRFVHEFCREVLYKRIPDATRRLYHSRIAEHLERACDARGIDVSAELALHCEQAGDFTRAVRYHRSAAELALVHGAGDDADASLSRVFELIQQLPAGRERNYEELRSRLMYSSRLHARQLRQVVGPSTEQSTESATPTVTCRDVEAAYTDLLTLCSRMENSAELIDALLAMSGYRLATGDVAASLQLICRALDMASDYPEKLCSVLEHHTAVLLCVGNWNELYAAAVQRLEATDAPGEIPAVGFVSRLPSLHHLAEACWALGRYRDMMTVLDNFLEIGRKSGHPKNLAAAQAWTASLLELAGEDERSIALLDSARSIITKHGLVAMGLYADGVWGWLLARRGRTSDGITLLERVIESLRRAKIYHWMPSLLACLAESGLLAGKGEVALAATGEALALSKKTGLKGSDIELHRLRAEALMAAAPQVATVHFQEALRLARQQGARGLELATAVRFGRLLLKGDQRDTARNLLAPLCEWFVDEVEVPDLREARALLAAAR